MMKDTSRGEGSGGLGYFMSFGGLVHGFRGLGSYTFESFRAKGFEC